MLMVHEQQIAVETEQVNAQLESDRDATSAYQFGDIGQADRSANVDPSWTVLEMAYAVPGNRAINGKKKHNWEPGDRFRAAVDREVYAVSIPDGWAKGMVDVTFTEDGSLGIHFNQNADTGLVSIAAITDGTQATRQPALRVGLILRSVAGASVAGKDYQEVLGVIEAGGRPVDFSFEDTDGPEDTETTSQCWVSMKKAHELYLEPADEYSEFTTPGSFISFTTPGEGDARRQLQMVVPEYSQWLLRLKNVTVTADAKKKRHKRHKRKHGETVVLSATRRSLVRVGIDLTSQVIRNILPSEVVKVYEEGRLMGTSKSASRRERNGCRWWIPLDANCLRTMVRHCRNVRHTTHFECAKLQPQRNITMYQQNICTACRLWTMSSEIIGDGRQWMFQMC